MRGITNAPQGAGGSGGEWTRRPNNTDWTDLFDVDQNNYITAKKDMFLYSIDAHYKFAVFIPKGFAPNGDTINISTVYSIDSSGNNIKLGAIVRIAGGYIASGSFTCVKYIATFTTDGNTITVTKTQDTSDSISKNSIHVWVRE